MEKIVLKKEYVDLIKKDPMLYGTVAKVLGFAPSSLPRLLNGNDEKLTQAGVLKVIGEHLGVQDSTQFLEMQVTV